MRRLVVAPAVARSGASPVRRQRVRKSSAVRPYVKLQVAQPDGAVRQLMVDSVILEEIQRRGLDIGFPVGERYPWIFSGGQPLDLLHRVAARIGHDLGLMPTIGEDQVVHHQNERVEDARLSNLLIVEERAHRQHHAAERRAPKPTPRQREQIAALPVGGWWSHKPAAKVRTLDPSTVVAEPPTPRSRASETPAQQVRRVLSSMLPSLRDELAHLDSGLRIQPAGGRLGDERSREMGLRRRTRLDTSGPEAALVGLLIKHRFDRGAVADAIACEVTRREVVVAVVAKMLATPAVDLALSRWLKFRRLPRRLCVAK